MTNLIPCLLEQNQKEYPTDRRYQITWRTNEPMSRHTTFRIGGSAALYAVCETMEALAYMVTLCRTNNIRYMVLGCGSNVLFADEGYDGVILSTTGLHEIRVEENILHVQAGASLTAAAKLARDASLTGMEFAHGIPGSLGGAVFMNAGAYDGEMKDIVLESTYLDAATGEIHTLTGEAHQFGYRESVYRAHPAWIILSAKLRLQPGNKDEITAKMDDLMSRRISKQPLEYPSAGSTFKRYPGRYTAQMIDELGMKGWQIGGAQVSEKHAGFIINKGGATCADVLALIGKIQETIYESYGIRIECELIPIR